MNFKLMAIGDVLFHYSADTVNINVTGNIVASPVINGGSAALMLI
jgi:hypothetical protein